MEQFIKLFNTYRRFLLVFALVLTLSILLASRETKEEITESVKAEIVVKKKGPTRKYTRNVKIRNDKYDLHRGAAERLGVGLVDNDNEISRFKNAGKLVDVKPAQGFKIHDLTHSSAVLTQKAYEMLKEIGIIYNETAGYDNYFMVTSLTRPLSSQKKLRKSNINATKGISTHSYGVSFDISYVRFNGIKGDYPKEREMLESILHDLQKDKRIYVVREKQTGCYHVTIR
jgi:hypothetical protein